MTVSNPVAYLSDLSCELDPLKKNEEIRILKPSLADLYVTDRSPFALAAVLVKEKLGIGRRPL